MPDMQRVLDLDLDFFVQGVVHCPPSDERADPTEYKVALGVDTILSMVSDEEIAAVDGYIDDLDGVALGMRYARERLGLDGPIRGAPVEHHDEVFALWERLIDAGELRPPFHLTHVDAHGDFGKGQLSHRKVLTDVMALDQDARPARSHQLLDPGDYLLHAVACGWVGAIDYVYPPAGGDDIDRWYWEGLTTPRIEGRGRSGTVRLARFDERTLSRVLNGAVVPVDYGNEPRVPMAQIPQETYSSADPFDFLFLAKSPQFTPEAADALYEQIRTEFIRELWP